jgi:2-(3-amino-3-carboxypropyl)histidine synthase
MKILLQVPEGLKTKVLEITKEIESEGNEVIISSEPCYGACDLREKEALILKCDKIIHYGHSKLIESRIPVEYREIRQEIDPIPIIEENFEKIKKYNSFGLVTTIQFLDSLEKVKQYLESKEKKVVISEEDKLYPGQILGCKVPKFDTECILYIGSGRFHPAGIALKNNKPVFVVDIEKNTLEDIEELKNKFLKQSQAAIALAKDAKTFGILISTKPGQLNIESAENIKKLLKESGKEAFMLTLDEIKPDKLLGIKCDAYINTACPRITIEDRTSFEKPILNPDEIKEALNSF